MKLIKIMLDIIGPFISNIKTKTKNNPVFWIIFLILFLNTTNATINEGLTNCYPYDSNASDIVNGFNGSVNGATLDTTNKKLGTSSYYFDGNDWISFDSNGAYNRSFMDTGQVTTITFWSRLADISGGSSFNIFEQRNSAGSNRYVCWFDDANNEYQFFLDGTNIDSNYVVSANTFYHITLWNNGSIARLYIDGVQYGTNSSYTPADTDYYIQQGRLPPSGAEYYIGQIDELKVWNRALTYAEILQDYNTGSGLTCNDVITAGSTPPPPDNSTLAAFLIYAKSRYNNATINTYNATVDGVTYGTTTGLINVTLNNTYLHNITIFKTTSYLNNLTQTNYNISTDLTAYLYAATATVTAKEYITNAQINSFGAGDSVYYNTTTIGTVILYLDAGTYNLKAAATNYYNITPASFTVAALDTEAVELTFFKLLNVTAFNNNDRIDNFTITLKALNFTSTQINSTTAGYFYYPAINQTYNITVDADGYALYANSLITTLNYSNTLTTIKFILYTSNSFDITFKDEASQAKLNTTTIYLDLISDTYSNNYSTANGTLYIDLLTPETYTFRYYGAGYSPRLSSYTLTNRTYTDITLYLLSGGQNTTLYVYDTVRNPVESAEIKIYRYSTASNSYILMNTITTDFEGKAIVNLQQNAEFYRFYIYYNSVLKKSTSPAYVQGSELVFTINLDDVLLENYYKTSTEYTHTLSYGLDTNNFKFYYDTNGEASQGCLYVYKLTTTGGETLHNSSCDASPSATILLAGQNVSDTTYIAKSYVTVGGQDIQLKTLTYSFTTRELNNNIGLIFIIFLIIMFALMARWSMSVSFIFSSLALMLGSSLGWVNIPMGVAIGVFVAGSILGGIIDDRRGG